MTELSSAHRTRIAQGIAKQGFMDLLGASLTDVAPGRAHLAVPFSDGLSQQHGLFHGGVTATLADNSAGIAGYTLMGENEQPLSVEFKISFVAPARGDGLEARACVVRNGRRLKHVSVDVFATDGGDETLVAVALATVAATRSVSIKPDTQEDAG